MVRTTKITFHVYDKRTGGNFQDFVIYCNPMNCFDLVKYAEFQQEQIESLGYAVTSFDFETRYTEADLAYAFESSGVFCVEPGFTKIPEMPRWGMPMSESQSVQPQ